MTKKSTCAECSHEIVTPGYCDYCAANIPKEKYYQDGIALPMKDDEPTMKKWTVTVSGTLKFYRHVVLFAQSEEQAADAAEAVIKDVMKPSDEVYIDEIYANEFEEDESKVKYEVGFMIKSKDCD